MGFTTNYANTILTQLFSGSYIALATSAPTATTSGSGLAEPPTSAGYARAAANTGSFKADARKIINKAYIYFPEATDSWGTITHMCVVTGESRGTGDLRYFGQITNPSGGIGVNVGPNSVPLFKPNAINISLDAD